MDNKKQVIPKWIWNSLVVLFILSGILITVCIFILNSAERVPINIITIIGTVFGVVGIVIAIYQQIQLISVSNAIKNTTTDIEKQIMNTHFEVNIQCGIRCLQKIEHFLSEDTDTKRIQMKLDDLHEHVSECKKIIEKNNKLNSGENANFTSDKYNILCTADKKIERFEIQILTSGFSIGKLKADTTNKGFISFIIGLKRDFNQMKKIQYSI